MQLSSFIEQELDPILEEWDKFARTQLPAAKDLSPEDLRDGAKRLLLAVAANMRSEQSSGHQLDKSRGERPEAAPELTRQAQDHARHRFMQRFTLNQMVSEYRALRATVLQRWTVQLSKEPILQPEALTSVIRFGEAIDQALTESVAWYSAKDEESRTLLLGVLGHDLRSPLGAVVASATYLMRTERLDGVQTKAVTRILNSATTMKRLVDDILDFTRTVMGAPIPIAPIKSNLAHICRDVLDELQSFHVEHQFDIRCSGDLHGEWGVSRIRQLVSNLANNAVKYGDPRKPVSFLLRAEPEFVELQVHNEGKPIPADLLGTLFEPLKRGLSPEGEVLDDGGLGLGLYIAREIATAHGGTITIDSLEKEGTTFTVRLPRSVRVPSR